jgi:mannose/fructose-specific phosphotransferase system component IIA
MGTEEEICQMEQDENVQVKKKQSGLQVSVEQSVLILTDLVGTSKLFFFDR